MTKAQKIILIEQGLSSLKNFLEQVNTLIDTCNYNKKNNLDKKENVLNCFSYLFKYLYESKELLSGIGDIDISTRGMKKRYILHEKNIYEFNSATVYEREVFELKGDKVFKTKMLNYLMVDFKRKSINNTVLNSKKEALLFMASRRLEDKFFYFFY